MHRHKVLKIVVGLVLLQAVLVLAFVLPGHDPRPHDVPVGVVGPPAAAQALEARAPDALAAQAFPTQAAAREAIEDREVYGALVPGEDRLLVAGAASPAVAQLLEASVGRGATVQDVVPLDRDDPRGATLNLLFLPLIVVCLPGALLLGALRLPARGLLGAVALFAALGGLLVVGAVQAVTGALPGSTWALAGVAALTILAILATAVGFVRLLGPAGLALSALLFFLIGNPGSGNASAPELLPAFWREVGQLLPPGAGGSALRGTAYFDGAGLLEPLLVLGAWALLGVALVLVGGSVAARRRRRVQEGTTAPAAPVRHAAVAA